MDVVYWGLSENQGNSAVLHSYYYIVSVCFLQVHPWLPGAIKDEGKENINCNRKGKTRH